jgi:peptidoglycan hydrolase CwlO-like protein
MNELTIVLFLAVPLGSIITYIFTRRKNRADARKSELDNVDKAVSIWRSLAQDLEKEIKDLRQEVEDIRTQQQEKCKNCRYRKFYNEQKG